jgi:hypothetical protein
MNPTITQMLVQSRQHELDVEAARKSLAATAKAGRTAQPGPVAATRRLAAGLALPVAAVAR